MTKIPFTLKFEQQHVPSESNENSWARKKLNFLTCSLFIFSFSFFGCSSALIHISPEQGYAPRFKGYEGTSQKTTKSSAITAAISPIGELNSPKPPTDQSGGLKGLPFQNNPTNIVPDFHTPFSIFQKKLLNETERLMLEKGIGVKTTFQSLEHMTYEDKKTIHYVAIPEVLLNIDQRPNCTSKRAFFIIFPGHWDCHSRLMISLSADLVLIEPQSKEKLWIKNLSVEPINTSCEAKTQFHLGNQLHVAGIQARKALASACESATLQALDSMFTAISKMIYTFLPPHQEAQNLVRQALEIKSRKVF